MASHPNGDSNENKSSDQSPSPASSLQNTNLRELFLQIFDLSNWIRWLEYVRDTLRGVLCAIRARTLQMYNFNDDNLCPPAWIVDTYNSRGKKENSPVRIGKAYNDGSKNESSPDGIVGMNSATGENVNSIVPRQLSLASACCPFDCPPCRAQMQGRRVSILKRKISNQDGLRNEEEPDSSRYCIVVSSPEKTLYGKEQSKCVNSTLSYEDLKKIDECGDKKRYVTVPVADKDDEPKEDNESDEEVESDNDMPAPKSRALKGKTSGPKKQQRSAKLSISRYRRVKEIAKKDRPPLILSRTRRKR